MLTTLEFNIKTAEKLRIPPHYGALLHGVLMQHISTEYAETLHKNQLKPFSQYVYFNRDKKQYVWKISALTEDAKTNILTPLMNNIGDKLHLENRGIYLEIESRNLLASTSYKELADKHFIQQEYKKKNVITFLTPTSFKSGGNYIIFPEVHNIYTNLFNNWNAFATGVSLDDKDVLDHLINHTKLIGYDLRSTKFNMEKVRINSFQGEICLHIAGPETLTRIANLLFAFGEYAGIGAKTALGMGGIIYE